eukprot:TRINITY_DN122350_c0_g1_i1.p1 TRINITY_DN122350_c0_g1~~TRINITY_DN122350_c0_g1_i1.p1  ORF type:complete len:515 (-),score=118.81 TRINITY_DN122350_c0_g1_i1:262-1806(-)
MALCDDSFVAASPARPSDVEGGVDLGSSCSKRQRKSWGRRCEHFVVCGDENEAPSNILKEDVCGVETLEAQPKSPVASRAQARPSPSKLINSSPVLPKRGFSSAIFEDVGEPASRHQAPIAVSPSAQSTLERRQPLQELNGATMTPRTRPLPRRLEDASTPVAAEQTQHEERNADTAAARVQDAMVRLAASAAMSRQPDVAVVRELLASPPRPAPLQQHAARLQCEELAVPAEREHLETRPTASPSMPLPTTPPVTVRLGEAMKPPSTLQGSCNRRVEKDTDSWLEAPDDGSYLFDIPLDEGDCRDPPPTTGDVIRKVLLAREVLPEAGFGWRPPPQKLVSDPSLGMHLESNIDSLVASSPPRRGRNWQSYGSSPTPATPATPAESLRRGLSSDIFWSPPPEARYALERAAALGVTRPAGASRRLRGGMSLNPFDKPPGVQDAGYNLDLVVAFEREPLGLREEFAVDDAESFGHCGRPLATQPLNMSCKYTRGLTSEVAALMTDDSLYPYRLSV